MSDNNTKGGIGLSGIPFVIGLIIFIIALIFWS